MTTSTEVAAMIKVALDVLDKRLTGIGECLRDKERRA